MTISRPTGLEDTLLDLAWSHWTELGVRGTVQFRGNWSIDPEALVILTAELAESDPRLKDESIDWILQSGRYLSRSRMRNLRDRLAHHSNLDRYLATLSAAGSRGWLKTKAKPWPFARSSKSELADLRRSALLRLRMRAIFGVGARAEILNAFLVSNEWLSSAEIASNIGYTKRNTVDELEGLRRAGLVQMVQSGNRNLFRLADREALERFVGPTPTQVIDWVLIFTVFSDTRKLRSSFEGSDIRVRDVEATRLLEDFGVRQGTGQIPDLPQLGPDAYQRLIEWTSASATSLLNGADL